MIAGIIVDVSHSAVDQTFDYLIPSDLVDVVRVGQRVEIPFGPRVISGIITEIKEESFIQTLKPIKRILELKPLFNQEMLSLADALSQKYVTPKMHYFHAMLPNAMKMTYQKSIRLVDPTRLESSISHYFKKDTVLMDKIEAKDYKTIQSMIELGVIEPFTKVKQRQGVKTKEMVLYIKEAPLTGKKQRILLSHLQKVLAMDKTELLEETKASSATLNGLIEKGLVKKVSYETYREIKSYIPQKDKTIILNDDQVLAYKTVKEALGTAKTFLLHGITSSGKTEVYIELAKAVINQGKSVLMLVPEISLTPLLTARFKAVFNNQVAVYHSKLSIGEQYDEWRKILRNDAHIMIGARSAVFAPMRSIGLVIIDEEHSDSYVQKDTPFYDAKKIAVTRSIYHNAPLLLGSATPSVESYFYAKQNKYHLIELKKRALNSTLPTIELVDMKQEFLKGNKSIFSEALQAAMTKRFENHEQTLLLINRRGHANFVLCRSCGQAITCKHCDITMTYHHHDQSLKCHYCNYVEPVPKTCPTCKSPHIRFMGLGSEQVEASLKKLFKDASIYRMDKDTTTEKYGHEKILEAFEKNGDFLVGTQMISKGLDFDNVTLVGVLSADMSLYIPSYDALEETFNLLTQVAGRSGRRHDLGEVIIQAYDASHPLLKRIQTNDYQGYIESELTSREKALMPPFVKMKKITITHKLANESFKKATQIKTILTKELASSCKIIGPIKPKIAKINNLYRTHILVKYKEEAPLLGILNAISQNIDYTKFGFIVSDDANLI